MVIMLTKWTTAMTDTSHMAASISNMMPGTRSRSKRDLRTLKGIYRTAKLITSWALEGSIASGRHTMTMHRMLKVVNKVSHSLNRAMTISNGVSNHLQSRTSWISRSRSGRTHRRVYHLYMVKHKMAPTLSSSEILCKIRIQTSATSPRSLNTQPKILKEHSSRCSCQTKCTPLPPPHKEQYQIWIISTHRSSKIWSTTPLAWTRTSTTANRIKRTKKTIRMHRASFSESSKEPTLKQISNSSWFNLNCRNSLAKSPETLAKSTKWTHITSINLAIYLSVKYRTITLETAFKICHRNSITCLSTSQALATWWTCRRCSTKTSICLL